MAEEKKYTLEELQSKLAELTMKYIESSGNCRDSAELFRKIQVLKDSINTLKCQPPMTYENIRFYINTTCMQCGSKLIPHPYTGRMEKYCPKCNPIKGRD